jgi:transcriptional regulator with XRE-family HTH domain
MSEPTVVNDQRRVQQRLISSSIGARVSGLRRKNGLRVADLAAMVGVSPSLISQIERGRTTPSVATLFMLAKAFAVPVDDLFDEISTAISSDVPAEALPEPGVPPESGSARSQPGAASEAAPDRGRRYLVRKAERATLDVRGGVQWQRLTPTTTRDAEFLELVYGPGAESDTQLYRHPGWEMVVTLCGRLVIYVGFERYELAPGDSMCFPSSRPHRYVNPSNETTRAITVILPDAAWMEDMGASTRADDE